MSATGVRRGVAGGAVIVAAAICAGSVGIAAFGAVRAMLGGSLEAGAMARAWGVIDVPLLVRTIGVGLAIGVIATVLAFPAAWSMRRLSSRWAALLVAPMLLPNYLVYVGWGLLRAPGTWLGDALTRADSPAMWKATNLVQSGGGLAMWAWPVAAVVLGAGVRRVDRETLEALRVAGGAWWRRAWAVLVEVRRAIVASVAIVALLMIGSAVPLHVAQIETYAIVVWRTMMESADVAPVWVVASPLILATALAGGVLGWSLARWDAPTVGVDGDGRVSRLWIVAAALIWIASTLAPLALFLANLREVESLWRRAPSVFGAGVLGQTILIGGAVAGVAGVAMVGLASGLASRSAWARATARACVCVWVAAGIVPGVLIGFGVSSASYSPSMAWLGDTALGVIVAQVARLGAIAGVGAWWLANIEAPGLRDARRLYAGDGLRAWWASSGRAQAAPGAGIVLAIALLSAHEIEATTVVGAPGDATLAQRMLSLLHYLREEELKVATAWIMGAGLLLAFVGILLASGRGALVRAARATALVALTCAPLMVIGGCDRIESSGDLPGARVIGERGIMSGQLFIPRAIDTDGRFLWVADKTDRIQRFDPESGDALIAWRMPTIEKGNPCGITCGPDGRVYVADTHAFCVRVYDIAPDGYGERLATFGAYGTGDGQFTYPTDVCVVMDDDGMDVHRIYVSEYGGNDRISVFDASYRFLFAFGAEGSGDLEFERPQSIEWDPARRELVVADTVNHRVGRFTGEGELIAWIGAGNARPGAALGEFSYPYGVCLLGDALALVAEFGNNRIQLIDLERGVGLATYGRGGREPGRLATPWGVTAIGRRAYVVDTGNHRIQSFELPRRVSDR